jgi:diacylglycerol kinase family enzyme
LFARGIVHRYYRGTDRRRPALTVERDGQPPVPDLFMGIVTSSAPWTYVRGHPVLPVPDPDFSSGLDLLALSRLRASTITSAIGQMMCMPLLRHPPRGRHIVTAHHLDALTISSSRPIAWHVDGEYLGETESVKFQYVPDALRVVAPGGGE